MRQLHNEVPMNILRSTSPHWSIVTTKTAWRHTGLILISGALATASCSAPVQSESPGGHEARLSVSSTLPADIEGGAKDATLATAATFSWNQLIAMNWAAEMTDGSVSARGKSAPGQQSADMNVSAPRVWETLRAKTEVFPGTGNPHGSELGPQSDYGYDQPPEYFYDPGAVGSYPGLEPGQVPACDSEDNSNPAPWIELSESHEVGPEQMFAGMSPFESESSKRNDQRVLYAVKVDRNFYRYIAETGWLGGGAADSTIPADATVAYFSENHAPPPAGSTKWVSFPSESVQIKTAWRRLSAREQQSGRFFTAWARSYQAQDDTQEYNGVKGNPDYPCFVDSYWGLVGIHLKTRTETAPFYIWSTFEHADNLVDRNGNVTEDAAGRFLGNQELPPTDPAITSRPAVSANPPTPDTIQKMTPAQAQAEPGRRLYYANQSGTPTTQGVIAVNRRQHQIAEPVIQANEMAHQAIREFVSHEENRGKIPAVLMNYKLVGVQWRPADKPVPGQDVVADPNQPDEVLRYPSIYYLANLMLETSYRLQNYSGVVQSHLPAPNQQMPVQDLVSDFDAKGKPTFNVYRDGQANGFNMGGCMGCHGQMQLKGYDFNFIFRRGRVNKPEMDVSVREPLIDMVHPRHED